MTNPQDPNDMQKLARTAATVQTFNILIMGGAIAGGIGGFLLGAYLTFEVNLFGDGLGMIFAPLAAILIGWYLGSRVVLALLSR